MSDLPSAGRIVTYHVPDGDSFNFGPETAPAMIQSVEADGAVNLHVFRRGWVQFVEKVPSGAEPGRWMWPTRI